MTDHRTESERIAESANTPNFQNGHNGYGLPEVIAAIDAQRHATLYLAEQQRIANLIALYDTDHPARGDAYNAIFDAMHVLDPREPAVAL